MQQTRPVWLKVMAGVLGLVLTMHLAATLVFVGPDNALKSALREPLDSYMLSMFQQSWNLFAPNPVSRERSLVVRGWFDAGDHTEWVNVTDLEIESAITHNLTPSRAGIVTRRLATRIGQQHSRLTESERQLLTEDQPDDAWSNLRQQMLDDDDHSPASRIDHVLRYDRTITAYATQFAWAYWGEDSGIQQVEFKIEEYRAPRFENRNVRGAAPDPHVREFGRRPLVEFAGQDRESFAAAIDRFVRNAGLDEQRAGDGRSGESAR